MELIQKFENGILICIYPKNLLLDLPSAKKLVRERLQFQNGKSYPVLIHINGVKFGSYEARKYLNKEGIKGIKAGAFIVNNSVESTVLNFFLSVNKPAIPGKMFPKGKESEAIAWLNQFK